MTRHIPKTELLYKKSEPIDHLSVGKGIALMVKEQNNISIILCDHQARDLLSCVDLAIVLSNGKVIAKDTPNNLIKNIAAQEAYFGDSFKIN